MHPVDPPPVVPAVLETGYAYEDRARRRTMPCTERRLLDLCASAHLPPRVRTPETDGMVPPWTVPALLPPIRTYAGRRRGHGDLVLILGLLAVSWISGGHLLAGIAIAAVAGGAGWALRTPRYSVLARDEAAQLRHALVPPPFSFSGERPTWEDVLPLGPKPALGEYGMISPETEQPVAATREALIEEVRRRRIPLRVWTPESEAMVPVWEVPFLVDEMAAPVPPSVTRGREMWIMTLFAAVVSLGLAVMHWVFGAIAAVLLGGWLLFVRSGRGRGFAGVRALDLRAQMDALAEARYRATLPAEWTRAISYTLVATGALQLFIIPVTVRAGGLNPADVAAGQWRRLFTAPMLHGGAIHWGLNWMALLALGRDMETRAPRGWVPVTFLFSALAGGVASLLVPPDTASVGASGGLMGLFGFLAVMAHRRPADFSRGFLGALLRNIALIAFFGFMASEFIDNGAHAGGLLAGALVGWIAVPREARVAAWRGGPRVEQAGRAALWILYASAAAAFVATGRALLHG